VVAAACRYAWCPLLQAAFPKWAAEQLHSKALVNSGGWRSPSVMFLHEVGNLVRTKGGQRGIPMLSNPGIPAVTLQSLVLALNKQVKDIPCENLFISLDFLM